MLANFADNVGMKLLSPFVWLITDHAQSAIWRLLSNPAVLEEACNGPAYQGDRTMATTIDEHTGKASLGCFLVCVKVNADVALLEDEKQQFSFNIKYSYSGAKSGQGVTNLPVSGNTSGSIDFDGARIEYAVSNWNLTGTTISCDLSASVEYTKTPRMGPSTIFKNQLFRGSRASVQHAESQARFDKKYAAVNAAMQKASGMSLAEIIAQANS